MIQIRSPKVFYHLSYANLNLLKNQDFYLKNSKGIILLEAIVSITIISIILPIVLLTFTRLNKSILSNKRTISLAESYYRLNAYIERIVEESDLHALPIYPFIHQPGIITNNTGKLINTNFNPQKNSNAITQIEVYPKTRLIKNGSNTYCNRFGEIQIKEEPKEILAYNTEKIWVLKLLKFNQIEPNCIEINLAHTKSILFNESLPLKPNYLIPIRRTYTIYIDEELNLRFITNLGEKILENQPIIKLGFPISLSIEKLPKGFFIIYMDSPFGRKAFYNSLQKLDLATLALQ